MPRIDNPKNKKRRVSTKNNFLVSSNRYFSISPVKSIPSTMPVLTFTSPCVTSSPPSCAEILLSPEKNEVKRNVKSVKITKDHDLKPLKSNTNADSNVFKGYDAKGSKCNTNYDSITPSIKKVNKNKLDATPSFLFYFSLLF